MVKEGLSPGPVDTRPMLLRSVLLLRASRDAPGPAEVGSCDAVVLCRTLDRAPAADIVCSIRAAAPGRPVFVEIGPLAGDATERELDALMAGGPDGVVLAGGSGLDLQRLGAKLAVREAECGIARGRTLVLALPASRCAGLLDLATVPGAGPRLAGLGWDAEALASELGVDPGDAGQDLPAPLALARGLTVVAARAAGVPAIDTATRLQGEALRAACRRARADGFAAKFARDLAQVAIINAMFGSPS